jgi:prepilin-type N-terminal cleavage/methylation domain-containing protein
VLLDDGVVENGQVHQSAVIATDADSDTRPHHGEGVVTGAPRPIPGFTLIEILVVIIVIGILAAIAILHLSPLKDKGYTTSLVEDLRNLETAEEAYFIEYATYTPSLPSANYMPTTGNSYSITAATITGWSATASTSHAMASSPSSCHIASGSAATTEGEYPGTVYCP